METKQPRRLKFWLLVILGYIVLFVVGFTSPIVIDRITGGAQRETTETAQVSSDSSDKQAESTSKTDSSSVESETYADAESTVATSSADEEDEASSSTATTTGTKLNVPQGATAYSIAKQYGLTVAQLQALNPTINMDGLQAGQIIVVSK